MDIFINLSGKLQQVALPWRTRIDASFYQALPVVQLEVSYLQVLENKVAQKIQLTPALVVAPAR